MRLDDDKMNISPEVAAYLGSIPRTSVQPTRASALETYTPEDSLLSSLGTIIGGIFAVCVLFVSGAILLCVICWVINIFRGPTPATTAVATNASPQVYQLVPSALIPGKRRIVSRAAPDASVAYLPPEYDIGRIDTRIILVREMPRGGAVDPLPDIPAGTCLLFERANANGWRRVVSFDGKYLGYAQLFPTSHKLWPMRPLYSQLIPLLRRIP